MSDEQDVQDQWISLVAHNWTHREYERLAMIARLNLASQVRNQGRNNGTYRVARDFVRIWNANITLAEEIVWVGLATGVEHD
jgi:hypothetical protein